MLRVHSPLPEDVERLIHDTIGCCIRVPHHQQILSYMRVAHLRAGLLVNFNVAILPDGLSRKIL
jgi:hypothetical protein